MPSLSPPTDKTPGRSRVVHRCARTRRHCGQVGKTRHRRQPEQPRPRIGESSGRVSTPSQPEDLRTTDRTLHTGPHQDSVKRRKPSPPSGQVAFRNTPRKPRHQHHLPRRMTLRQQPLRHGRLRQREGSRRTHRKRARLGQFDQGQQVPLVESDEHRNRAGKRNLRDRRHPHIRRGQVRSRRKRAPPDRVEHRVDTGRNQRTNPRRQSRAIRTRRRTQRPQRVALGAPWWSSARAPRAGSVTPWWPSRSSARQAAPSCWAVPRAPRRRT